MGGTPEIKMEWGVRFSLSRSIILEKKFFFEPHTQCEIAIEYPPFNKTLT